jgi:LmbE family N-acetylglucosaminyl deacetylase
VGALRSRRIVGSGTPESDWAGWPGFAQMSEIEPGALVPPGHRALVIAPHPDDEVLGIGGLLAQLARIEAEILIIALTEGEASHPGSTRWPPLLLAEQRDMERSRALQLLGVDNARVVRAKQCDGALHAQEDEVAALLSRYIGSDDVVFVPWRSDGHPDHEAAGRAAMHRTSKCGAKLVEVPIWMWHWAAPEDGRVPWSRARRVFLDSALHARKQSAVAAYSSQIEADPSTGRGPVLPATALARLLRPFEVVFV